MPVRSKFTPPRPSAPAGRKLQKQEQFDLRGLNEVSPHDVLKDYESPYLRNARLYNRDDGERQTAISTRKGAGFYSVPVGETADDDQTSTTGAADSALTTTTWLAEEFTTTTAGRLTKVELNIKNDNSGTGPVIVEIYDDDSGEPGARLAQSSILSSEITSSYAYVAARFIDSPQLDSATKYWIVAYQQEGGTNDHKWSSTTSVTTSLTSNTSGSTWSSTSVGLNFKTYLSTNAGVTGAFRYYPTSGVDETLFWSNTAGYKIDDTDGSTSTFATGLSSSVTDTYAVQADDKVWYVNGVDAPRVYDGSTDAAVSFTGVNPGVSKLIANHKNRNFLVPVSDPTRINFSDIDSGTADYETFESTAFLYVPTPKSSDPITGLVSFQDSLVIFTRETKYILSGSDLATFTLRQSTGKKGAVNQRSIVTDENYIYFLSDDGVYRFNGASDELISDRVESSISDIADKTKAGAVFWDNQYRLYYQSSGQDHYDRMLLFDTTYEEWFLDTETHTKGAVVLTQDSDELVEFSDDTGTAYYGEQQYSQLGTPIDFEYRTKYYSWGAAAAKKQVRRLYPLLRSQSQAFTTYLEVDVDFANSPRQYELNAQGSGALIGEFVIGTDVLGQTQLPTLKVNVPGNKRYYQLRFVKNGVDTPVEILGYIMYYRYRRTV